MMNTMRESVLQTHRFLDDGGNTEESTFTPTSAPTAAVADTDTETLVTSLTLYGTLFILLFLLFCYVRQKYPRVYNVRSWVPDLKSSIAEEQFGFLSWLWSVQAIDDRKMLDECGMDAICMGKILKWGFEVACVGAFNALWLIPVYSTGDNDEVEDAVTKLTLTNVVSGDNSLISATIAAYILFGYAMYRILKEFEDFTALRYHFLSKPKARNYSVYVQNISESYRSNEALKEFFAESSGKQSIQDTAVKIETAELAKLVTEREALVAKLEHAINLDQVMGVKATHKNKDKEEVDSIETWADELHELNHEISQRIGDLSKEKPEEDIEANQAEEAEKKIEGEKEGLPYEGGFVTFNNITAAQAALQMNQHEDPFEMTVLEAPDPEDIVWQNVGWTHSRIQCGMLCSLFLTVVICIFWTIPMAFFSTISNVDELEKQFSFVKTANDNVPVLRPIVTQLAPFLVVIFNALLPMILTTLAAMEGHISNATISASLFVKLTGFMVIQTFFISAISGSLVPQLENIANDPLSIIDIMAESLPTRSVFFMQIIIIQTVFGLLIELLRVVPIIFAWIRGCIGPNLTEKERNTTYIIFAPLAEPGTFDHATTLAYLVLYFMVLFVYAVIAPITTFLLVAVFYVFGSGYRHQLMYIYPTKPDSGGKIWLNFYGIIMRCMLVAQVTLFGYLGAKESYYGSPLMIPLIIITMLFNSYIRQRHFDSTTNLPAPTCSSIDAGTSGSEFDTSEFTRLYLQPELQNKEVLPENTPDDLKAKIELTHSTDVSYKSQTSKSEMSSSGNQNVELTYG